MQDRISVLAGIGKISFEKFQSFLCLTSLSIFALEMEDIEAKNSLAMASPKSVEETWVQYCQRGCPWWMVTKSVKTSLAYSTSRLFQTTLKLRSVYFDGAILPSWLTMMYRHQVSQNVFRVQHHQAFPDNPRKKSVILETPFVNLSIHCSLQVRGEFVKCLAI